MLKPVLLIALLFCLAACSIQPWVKPYERGKLADPIMSFEQNPADAGFMSHMYQSREAARGAEGGAGGGCGCN